MNEPIFMMIESSPMVPDGSCDPGATHTSFHVLNEPASFPGDTSLGLKIPDNMPPVWLWPGVVAHLLDVPVQVLHRLVREGKFPVGFGKGDRMRWELSKLNKWMEEEQIGKARRSGLQGGAA